MALSVSLVDAALTLDPGGFVRTEVRIRTAGTSPERVQVRITGPAAAWSWVVPPEIDIAGASEAVVSLGFRVQRSAEPAAGTLAFDVTVTPADPGEGATGEGGGGPPAGVSASGSLTVTPFHQVSVELDPPGAGLISPTEHYVVVENRGNVPATTTLRTPDSGRVKAIGSEVVETAPGVRVVVPVTVHPGTRPLLRARSTPFAVSAVPGGGDPVTLSGAVHQPARLPARTAGVAAVAVVVLVALVLGLTVLGPDDSPVAVAGPSTTASSKPNFVAAEVDPRCPASGHTDPAPIGSVRDASILPAGFSFFRVADGDCMPVRWNPCEPIHYVVNPANAPPTGVSDVKEAFRRLAIATGMTYIDDGVTDEVTGGTARAYQPARYGEHWAPILVHWRPAGARAPTGNQTAGGGAPTRVGDVYVSGELLLTSAIVIDERTQTTIGGGFVDPITIGRIGSDGVRWGRVMLHELGHITGLGHVSETSQLMYPDASEHTGSTAFQAGDLAGLEFLGKDAGCIETPTPAPVAQPSFGARQPRPTTTTP